jgi:cation diffusion facilitator family transporter
MVSDRQIRNRDGVRRVLILTLSAHLLISGAKLAVGYHGNIVSLQADGLHSLFDALSNVIGLFALGYALMPPDPEHPYGHRKVEVVASLAIGIMLLLALLEIGRGIWGSLSGGRPPEVGLLALGVQCGAVVGALLISKYERNRARHYDSMLLEADSEHTLSDALSGLAVIAGMLLVTFGIPLGDVIAALVVMVFIGFAAYRVIRTVMDVMVDAAYLDAEEVCKVANGFPEVLSCHYVRSRGMQGNVHLDLHITMDPETTLAKSGDVMLALKVALRRKFPEVADIIIQVEPHQPEHYTDVPEQLV